MRFCYLGVQALQVGTDVLDARSERVDVQERWDDPWKQKKQNIMQKMLTQKLNASVV